MMNGSEVKPQRSLPVVSCNRQSLELQPLAGHARDRCSGFEGSGPQSLHVGA